MLVPFYGFLSFILFGGTRVIPSFGCVVFIFGNVVILNLNVHTTHSNDILSTHKLLLVCSDIAIHWLQNIFRYCFHLAGCSQCYLRFYSVLLGFLIVRHAQIWLSNVKNIFHYGVYWLHRIFDSFSIIITVCLVLGVNSAVRPFSFALYFAHIKRKKNHYPQRQNHMCANWFVFVSVN